VMSPEQCCPCDTGKDVYCIRLLPGTAHGEGTTEECATCAASSMAVLSLHTCKCMPQHPEPLLPLCTRALRAIPVLCKPT
jgi:hypothetical protein